MSSDPSRTYDELQRQAAVNAVRQKLKSLYGEEPPAKEELREVKATDGRRLSKHQRYMDELSRSGRGLAEIQTAWHEYYQKLPEAEKHEVWQEFYSQHAKLRQAKKETRVAEPKPAKPKPAPTYAHDMPKHRPPAKSAPKIKKHLLGRVNTRQRLAGKHHLQSILFGLGVGCIVILIFLFGFFNERFITPFIRPSYAITTPIIVDPTSDAKVGPAPKIIIPKINIEAPVVYDEPSINEEAVQTALERGVLHYSTTPNPGEKGNAVIFGHSSSNILNNGKYKFAFLLLKSLDKGDTFIIHKDSKRYVYKVYKKFVTDPKDTTVLGTTDKPATVTLITCDPPGLSTNRLIVVGEQIFPDPAKNKDSSVNQDNAQRPNILPSNSPSLWQRLIDWL